jgi:hypothetical protein
LGGALETQAETQVLDTQAQSSAHTQNSTSAHTTESALEKQGVCVTDRHREREREREALDSQATSNTAHAEKREESSPVHTQNSSTAHTQKIPDALTQNSTNAHTTQDSLEEQGNTAASTENASFGNDASTAGAAALSASLHLHKEQIQAQKETQAHTQNTNTGTDTNIDTGTGTGTGTAANVEKLSIPAPQDPSSSSSASCVSRGSCALDHAQPSLPSFEQAELVVAATRPPAPPGGDGSVMHRVLPIDEAVRVAKELLDEGILSLGEYEKEIGAAKPSLTPQDQPFSCTNFSRSRDKIDATASALEGLSKEFPSILGTGNVEDPA